MPGNRIHDVPDANRAASVVHVLPRGQGAFAVDAVIELDDSTREREIQ